MRRVSSSPISLQDDQRLLFPAKALSLAVEADVEPLSTPPRHTGQSAPTGVRKAVEAVLIRPKEGKVTLLCRRFFNVLLRHAQDNPVPDGEYHQMPLGKLTQDARYESRNMEYLTEVLNQMLATVVNWGDSARNLKGPKYAWSGASLLAFVRIEKDGRGPTMLYYDFHKEVRAQLLNPRVYAYVSLEMNAKMSTHPALALYELGVRYLSNKNGLTVRMPWREWVVPLTGNPDISKDLQYKYFARDVLKPALREVNESQDEFELIPLVGTVRRRVETLQFAVQRKTGATAGPGGVAAHLAEVEVDELTLIGRLLNLKVPQKTAEEHLKRYGANRLKAALNELEPRLPAIKNVGAYLKTLLENGDFPSPSDVVDVSCLPVAQGPLQESVAVQLQKSYRDEAKRKAYELFLEGLPAQQEELLSRFERERLEGLPQPLRKAWERFRAEWPQKPMTAFIGVPFRDWLIAAEPAPTSEQLLTWAVEQGKIQLTP